jgi:DNA-binding PadR family transcriptional regulator
MRSSIGWALLGLVIERPSYGYELAQRFRRVYGETLVLSNVKRIYEALDALRVRSLIEEAEGPAPEGHIRHPRPRYRATELGVSAYQDRLLAQIEEERQRHRMFARQLAMLEPNAALEVIDEYERECLAGADEVPPAEAERAGVAERLAAEEEQMQLEGTLTWIEYARNELRALLDEQAGEPEER